jgi:hypothetical protein
MSTLTNKFNLDVSLFEQVAENIDNLQSTARTQTLTVGKTVNFKGSINGIEVPANVTLKDASLSRLSVLRQQSPYTGKEYYLVTGVMNPVKMDLNIISDGKEINIIDLLHAFITETGKTVDRDKFAASLSSLGMNFATGMPLFFQQFGANEDGFKHAINAFKTAGAVDVTGRIETPGRIVAAYQHKTGVPLSSFELGTTDRSKSRTNQGFLNLVDAAVDTFQRVYGLRLQAHVLQEKMETLSQAKIKEAEEKRQKLMQLSRQWVSNWSGSQQRIQVTPSGAQEKQDIYDPVNAPCGRFTMVVNGTDVPCDLWSNSAQANSSAPSATSAVETDEIPF